MQSQVNENMLIVFLAEAYVLGFNVKVNYPQRV
jgi:hypothetical protein